MELKSIETIQIARLIVMIVWGFVAVSTIPFLILAGVGHHRSTLITVAVMGVLGLVISIGAYDSARTASEIRRPVRLWADYWLQTGASFTMAMTLGWRTWSVMLGSESLALTTGSKDVP